MLYHLAPAGGLAGLEPLKGVGCSYGGGGGGGVGRSREKGGESGRTRD